MQYGQANIINYRQLSEWTRKNQLRFTIY
jgi:hypothetical protein